MRLFEYESRAIVKRAGIPVTDYGFATTAQEASTGVSGRPLTRITPILGRLARLFLEHA